MPTTTMIAMTGPNEQARERRDDDRRERRVDEELGRPQRQLGLLEQLLDLLHHACAGELLGRVRRLLHQCELSPRLGRRSACSPSCTS